jgi:hypothetical protein
MKPGTVIADRYIITRHIGRGGMGDVYEARHLHIGRKLALKFLSREYSSDSSALKRFLQEAKIAGTMGHLNICEVTDFGVSEDGLPYIVMEFLEGESLASILEREKKLPPDVAFGVISQILGALEEVHGKGIIHRDLKPGNVFITTVKGHGLVVKLLDFGISKILKQGLEESLNLTKTGGMIGTPYYMSPEQIRGRGPVDHRADIFSCGVMAYEMITGELPFRGESVNEILAAILEDPAADLRLLLPDFPGEGADLIASMLEKDPDQRPQTAGALRESISRFVKTHFDEESGEYRPTGEGGRGEIVTRPMKRGSDFRLLALAGVVTVIAVAVVAVMWLGFSSARGSSGGNAASAAGTEAFRVSAASPAGEIAGRARAAAASKPRAVMITFDKTPPDVSIAVGDRVVDGGVLELPVSGEPVHMTIFAEGYQERDFQLVPTEDVIIDGTLTPLPEPAEGTEKPDAQAKKKHKPGSKTKKGTKSGVDGKPTFDFGEYKSKK